MEGGREENEQLRVRKKTLQAVLQQCQTALESLRNTTDDDDIVNSDAESSDESSSDSESTQLCSILKSTIESPDFLEKLGSLHMSVSQNMSEEGSSWDMVSYNDLWESGNTDGDIESDQEGYVLVRQDDIVEGIACFMAAYLLSLKETKDLAPNKLQDALSKTFSVKKRKGKLEKAWDGTKVVYNVASWGATAVGIYQNPIILKAATVAFWGSCHIISKLL